MSSYFSKFVKDTSKTLFKASKMYCSDSDQPLEKTSEFYRTCNLPNRFEYPSWFYGYGIQRSPPVNPFYRTTSSDYGRYPPTIHSVPTSFYPNVQEFTKVLARAGNYRNYSLNVGIDPTVI